MRLFESTGRKPESKSVFGLLGFALMIIGWQKFQLAIEHYLDTPVFDLGPTHEEAKRALTALFLESGLALMFFMGGLLVVAIFILAIGKELDRRNEQRRWARESQERIAEQTRALELSNAQRQSARLDRQEAAERLSDSKPASQNGQVEPGVFDDDEPIVH
jgi:hypothetical protein